MSDEKANGLNRVFSPLSNLWNKDESFIPPMNDSDRGCRTPVKMPIGGGDDKWLLPILPSPGELREIFEQKTNIIDSLYTLFDVDDTKITKEDGKTVIDAGRGHDNIRVSNSGDGGLDVYVNGKKIYLTAEEARNLEIRGGAGHDTIVIDRNVRQNITIDGGSGSDYIRGGRGNDRIFGGSGDDFIAGGRGNDTISGGSGNDTVRGGRGRDRIYGNGGNDNINGGRGRDLIFGGYGNDTVRGGRGSDMVFGNAGDDQIFGDRGNDFVSGGYGNERVHGGRGSDFLLGGCGNDELRGGRGSDILFGGNGDDDLRGGRGNDFHLDFERLFRRNIRG